MPQAVWSGFSRSWAFSAIWNAWRFFATFETSATDSTYPLADLLNQLLDGRAREAVAIGGAQDGAGDRVELGLVAVGHVAGHRAGQLGMRLGQLGEDVAALDVGALRARHGGGLVDRALQREPVARVGADRAQRLGEGGRRA